MLLGGSVKGLVFQKVGKRQNAEKKDVCRLYFLSQMQFLVILSVRSRTVTRSVSSCSTAVSASDTIDAWADENDKSRCLHCVLDGFLCFWGFGNLFLRFFMVFLWFSG